MARFRREQQRANAGPDERNCEDTPYPFNFSRLREGCTDPCLHKTILWLISSDDDYIVYVDEQYFVEWTMNDNQMLDEHGALLTRVGQLESAQTDHLTTDQIESFKRLVGEAVARLFEKNVVAAEAALNAAEMWIRARSQEAARVASLAGATAAFTVIAVIFTAAWFKLGGLIGGTRSMLALGTMLASLGAWLSVLQRTGREDLDIGAGEKLFVLEGAVRIAIGAVGGFFVALLLRAGWLLPDSSKTPTLFAAMCLVAGLSERLVNSLAGALEGRAQIQTPTTTTTTTGAQQAQSPAPQKPAAPQSKGENGASETETLNTETPSAETPAPAKGRGDGKNAPIKTPAVSVNGGDHRPGESGPEQRAATPEPPLPVPASGIVRLSTDRVRSGDSLTIEGRMFGIAAGKVTVGGSPAAITGWSDTSIVVTIPSIPSGLVDVVVETSGAERRFVLKGRLSVV